MGYGSRFLAPFKSEFGSGNVSHKFVNYNEEREIMGFKEEPTIIPKFMAYGG